MHRFSNFAFFVNGQNNAKILLQFLQRKLSRFIQIIDQKSWTYRAKIIIIILTLKNKINYLSWILCQFYSLFYSHSNHSISKIWQNLQVVIDLNFYQAPVILLMYEPLKMISIVKKSWTKNLPANALQSLNLLHLCQFENLLQRLSIILCSLFFLKKKKTKHKILCLIVKTLSKIFFDVYWNVLFFSKKPIKNYLKNTWYMLPVGNSLDLFPLKATVKVTLWSSTVKFFLKIIGFFFSHKINLLHDFFGKFSTFS